MRENAKLLNFITLLCMLFIISCNQKQSTEPKNQPPQIQSLSSNPVTSASNRLPSGNEIVFTVTATDPDKDQLSYTWSCTGGSFISGQNTNNSTWQSPVSQTTTQYTITVNVSDGAEITSQSKTAYVAAESLKGYVEGYTYYSGTTIPVSGVSINIADKYFTSGSDGYYRLNDIEIGSKLLKATKDGYDKYQTNINVAQNGSTKDVAMTSALYTHNLFGTIVSSGTQQPLQNVAIIVLNDDESSSQLQTTSDYSGYYQIPTVPQGQRKVKFQKQNYQTINPQIFMSNSDYQYNVQLLNKPGIPSNPSPSDLSVDIPFNNTIRWDCSDPNGDALRYDVYFGTNNPPTQKVSQDQTSKYLKRSGLSYNTTYYWKIISKDYHNNTTEGPIWSFTVENGGTITDIDGNIYNVAKIGNQWWILENLKVTRYNNGQAISHITTSIVEWEYCTSGAYCYYGNNANNGDIYGLLYNYNAIIDNRNIAPEGYHIPTDEEWQELADYLGGDNVAGGKMKEIGTTYWNSPNTGATNESGFTALPGGYRGYEAAFKNIGSEANFWSTTIMYGDNVRTRRLSSSNSKAYRYFAYKYFGLSVRCVKD